ncbi:osmotically inducible protein OsmC [Natrinema saccharevitans]|uniref:Osmotically inducible protein OsmC n=1 Tax=Natrinema saccharevitans TaxID=301967 RepID=A0A1S8AWB2_9EURY|nr:OsmC family protein [Natrinema saccharevitans]OLZ41148.1 osmotically inducible protein OsmC [Natrinema saccharevitans]
MEDMNGLDVDELESLIDGVAAEPEQASFTFRAETEWTGGFASETRISDFEQDGTPIESPEFTVTGDEPAALLGERDGPNAVEHLLAAIGSCLSVTYAGHAAAKGIEIDEMHFEFEGDIDLRGFLGLSDDVRAGYEEIRATTHIDADASDEELEALHEEVLETSPLYDSVTNQVSLEFDLDFE